MAYSEDQIGEALAVLAANDGNAARTRRGLKAAGWEPVPTRSTLNRWAEKERRVEEAPSQATPREAAAAKNGHQKKKALADLFEALARQCLAEAGAKIEEASSGDLMRGAGISTDKMQLLRGSATEIQEQRPSGLNFYQQINAAKSASTTNGQSSATKDQ